MRQRVALLDELIDPLDIKAERRDGDIFVSEVRTCSGLLSLDYGYRGRASLTNTCERVHIMDLNCAATKSGCWLGRCKMN